MQKVVGSTPITRSIFFFVIHLKNHNGLSLTHWLDICCLSEMVFQNPLETKCSFPLLIPTHLCLYQAMSLTNDELEQQLLQLADALAKMSEMTATAFEDRDKHIEALRGKIEALESQLKIDD